MQIPLPQKVGSSRIEESLSFPFSSEILTISSGQTDWSPSYYFMGFLFGQTVLQREKKPAWKHVFYSLSLCTIASLFSYTALMSGYQASRDEKQSLLCWSPKILSLPRRCARKIGNRRDKAKVPWRWYPLFTNSSISSLQSLVTYGVPWHVCLLWEPTIFSVRVKQRHAALSTQVKKNLFSRPVLPREVTASGF